RKIRSAEEESTGERGFWDLFFWFEGGRKGRSDEDDKKERGEEGRGEGSYIRCGPFAKQLPLPSLKVNEISHEVEALLIAISVQLELIP
ncbi:MAG: hypothetical protein NT163_06580, partial [Chlorobiales bacterium]|nr:hypothetical protein [Chlorobiales bacterium]